MSVKKSKRASRSSGRARVPSRAVRTMDDPEILPNTEIGALAHLANDWTMTG
jgi:hypothetical protein